jgi:hypothetical protein
MSDCNHDMSLAYMLSQIGHKLVNIHGATAVHDEVISTMDHIRRAAFTKNLKMLECRPPVFMSDFAFPKSLLIYDTTCSREQFVSGHANMYNVRNLQVVGGGILHTKRVRVPVTILFSKTPDPSLIMHVAHAPMAALEAEMHDTAFSNAHCWERYVFQDGEVDEMLQWRKEAALESRRVGVSTLPLFMKNDNNVQTTRCGVLPFLSLRAPKDKDEWLMVCDELSDMLQVLPMCQTDLITACEGCKNVDMYTVLQTGLAEPGQEFNAPSADKRLDLCKEIASRSVITGVAVIILQMASDHAVDGEGYPLNEYDIVAHPHKDNNLAINELSSLERAAVERAKRIDVTQLQREMSMNNSFALPNVMKDMNRPYSTKLIAEKEGDSLMSLLEAVASDVFAKDELPHALQHCHSISPVMTISSALCALGKCVADHQALLVVKRAQDGRFEEVKLANSSETIQKVAKHNVERLVISPHVKTLIVDQKRVSLLLTLEPEDVRVKNLQTLDDDKLKCVEKSISSGQQDTAALAMRLTSELVVIKSAIEAVKFTMENVRQTNMQLVKENETFASSAADLKRKVDYLVTKMTECTENVDLQPKPPVVHPVGEFCEEYIMPNATVKQPCTESLARLKRLHSKLLDFDRSVAQKQHQ